MRYVAVKARGKLDNTASNHIGQREQVAASTACNELLVAYMLSAGKEVHVSPNGASTIWRA
jgi:hypothetical protein